MSDAPLFDVHAETRRRAEAASAGLDERFERFHADHPEVYDELVSLARTAKSNGRDRWSMKGLFELVRWNRQFETDPDEPFKLNNSYASRYARLVMDREADLAGFFETRTLRSN